MAHFLPPEHVNKLEWPKLGLLGKSLSHLRRPEPIVLADTIATCGGGGGVRLIPVWAETQKPSITFISRLPHKTCRK